MRTTFVAACLLALVAFAAAHTYADSDELCLTPDVDEHDDEMVQAIIERFKANVCPKIPEGLLPACGGAVRSSVAPFTIPLAWNILYDPETGLGSNITDEQIALQVDIMNEDYAGRGGLGYNTNWRFYTKSITRVANANYFGNMIVAEQFFKAELASNTDTTLHMYTGDMNGGVLGMCYFSFMYFPNDTMHGCLINYQAMVNGGASPYDSGQTATHEVGHHLGLYHVWQNKCGPRSDRVDDTPPQITNSRGCPDPIPESCTPGLFDNIHNHMDYSDDDCRYQFTEGQSLRTDDIISTFHPGYLSENVRKAIREAVPNAWEEAESFQLKFGRKMGFPNPFLGHH